MCKRVWYPRVVPRETLVYRRVSGSHTKSPHPVYFQPIGAPGFEPGTSCSQSRRATKLRHAPRQPSIGTSSPTAAGIASLP
jgi:hypothetical protein